MRQNHVASSSIGGGGGGGRGGRSCKYASSESIPREFFSEITFFSNFQKAVSDPQAIS